MATPGDLIAVVAESLGLPEVMVSQHDRNLASAGLRSKGGRGLSAAKMTADDAATLLIACVASLAVKDTVQAFELYGRMQSVMGSSDINKRLPSWELERFPIPELMQLDPGHTFKDALSALVKASSRGAFLDTKKDDHGNLPVSVSIGINAPSPIANIEIRFSTGERFLGSESRVYSGWESDKSSEALQAFFKKLLLSGDMRQERYFSLATINAVGHLLRG